MAKTVASLREKGALEYTIVVVTEGNDPPGLAYIAPYAATSIAEHYYRSVELGLGVCFRVSEGPASIIEGSRRTDATVSAAIVFGSDQGLVGRFNEVVVDEALKALGALGGKAEVWAVGERVHARLANAGVPLMGLFAVPNSVKAIAPLVGQILVESETRHGRLVELSWPTKNLPQVAGGRTSTLRAFIREYLFVYLFRACAESLASENASRLAAMERADRNISELLETLDGLFHRLRQSGIDEELFDVISGFEALSRGFPTSGS
jgi:F-type H+-transporting ATPase subunit gamma